MATVCSVPGCPNLDPCSDHPRRPWGGSSGADRRAARGVTGTGYDEHARNAATIRRHRGICYLCGAPGASEVDHVTELADGGLDIETNRRPVHPDCHAAKTRRARQERNPRT